MTLPSDQGEIDPAASQSEQMSAWWALLSSGNATAADRRAFMEWIARSPDRVEIFLRTACLDDALKSSNPKWPDVPIETLIRNARRTSEVVDLPVPRGRPVQPKRPLGWVYAALAAAALVGIVATGALEYLSPQHFQTGIGEQRTIVLSDGSVVTLNTSSKIEVSMSQHARIVRLLAGEGLFHAARDPTRPFDVSVGSVWVRAIGTQFNIDRQVGGTTVTVVEGSVAVTTRKSGSSNAHAPESGSSNAIVLAAGEQLTLAQRADAHPVRANIANATAWTQRKLIFDHRPLAEVAEEFNRYNERVIEIRGASLREQKVTGVFQADDPESFITILSKIADVSIERSADNKHFVLVQQEKAPSGR